MYIPVKIFVDMETYILNRSITWYAIASERMVLKGCGKEV